MSNGRIRSWVATTAAACAVGAAAAPPAGAGAPVGETIADGIPQLPVVDDERGSVAFVAAPGIVRVVDLRAGTTRDTDVRGGCAPNAIRPLVVDAADGAVLLACEVPVKEPWPGGPTRARTPRILDTADWTVKVPAALEQIGDGFVGLATAGIVVEYQERSGPWWAVYDWRTGAHSSGDPRQVCAGWRVVSRRDGRRALSPAYERCDGSDRGVLPVAPATALTLYEDRVSWSVRGIDDTMPLSVLLPECGVLARWEIGAIDVVDHLPGALLISSTGRGNGPLRLTRVPLDGLCERAVGRWRLRASAGGRTVAAGVLSARVADAVSGAETGPVALAGAAPRLRVGAGRAVRLRAAAAAQRVRWRVAGGGWQRAAGSDRGWRLTVPRRLRGSRLIEIETRLRDGGELRHSVRLTVKGNGR
ncbi:hypothetical protein VSS74_08275 [Conexibacter stalactiti]|uniref:Secreted protein n=1 Tax=Conexibacter stalactiti TaxID=1940611 RepID=A0ABU4HLZ8_9ACTN|nr:hypothetical protein [Conexibacter stalactiti]MDW5594328.1 hypothetical protein [Conexibacter stalactiti]MEC5034970.1 hypothetical protein [Conexibacter stalactiti]